VCIVGSERENERRVSVEAAGVRVVESEHSA
jgi:hypothetical protein